MFFSVKNDKILNSSKFVLREFSLFKYTVNDGLSTMGTYLNSKAFGLVLVWIGYLIRPVGLLKKYQKIKTRNVRLVDLSQNSS